jgi:primosomal replication protein N
MLNSLTWSLHTLYLPIEQSNNHLFRNKTQRREYYRVENHDEKKLHVKIIQKLAEKGIAPSFNNETINKINAEYEIDWNCMPAAIDPINYMKKDRAIRKRQQLQNIISCISMIINSSANNNSSKTIRVVDFCCGSGHVGLPLAYLFMLSEAKNREKFNPRAVSLQIFLVEHNSTATETAQERVKQLELQRSVSVHNCSLQQFNEQFEVGVGLHACGPLSDIIQLKCFQFKAAFVLSPCCLGKIRYGENAAIDADIDTPLNSEYTANLQQVGVTIGSAVRIHYPRSAVFESALNQGEYFDLAKYSDVSSVVNAELSKNSQSYASCCVNYDRCLSAEERGYAAKNVLLMQMQPPSCTPRNNLVVGFT